MNQNYPYTYAMEPRRSDPGTRSGYTLKVWQQPERARLCSYKEENDTVDRRPVDPPPVVEMQSSHSDLFDLVESTSFFIRATIVHSTPSISASSSHQTHPNDYAPVKTPTGADATAGESIQTPEKLKGLDNKAGAVVVFAKLSVRIPGIFRLRFTLYETSEMGISEITSTVSEPFEVFSPKLFKGMKESTPLTRHLAGQGLKIKLRTDTSIGRHAESRHRAPVIHSPSPSPIASPPRPRPTIPPPNRPMLPPPHPSLSRDHRPSRDIIWRPGLPYEPRSDTGPTLGANYPAELLPPMQSRNTGDDGAAEPLHHLVLRLDHASAPVMSSDLLAFSLSQGTNSPQQFSGPTSNTPLTGDFSRDATRSTSATSLDSHFPPGCPPQSNNLSHALLDRYNFGLGDDGSAMLPAPLPMAGFSLTPHPRLPSLSSKSDPGGDSGGSRSLAGGQIHSGSSQDGQRHGSPPVKLAPMRGNFE